MKKRIGKFESSFWNILKRIGLFVAIPKVIGDLFNIYFGWSELLVMLFSAIILWIFYRESIILDLKNGRKHNGK